MAARYDLDVKLTESWGESKKDSKGEDDGSFLSLPVAFVMAAAINVHQGHAFAEKKKKQKTPALHAGY